MASVVYNRGKKLLASTATSWDSSTVYRLMLVEVRSTTAGADEDVDLNFVSDLTGLTGFAELTATNYARQNVANRVVTEDDTGNRVILDADDNVFTNLGVAAGTDGLVVAAVVYRQTGGSDATPDDDDLVALLEMTDTVTNGQNFTVQYSSAGLIAG